MNAPVDEARRSLDAQVASVLRACGGWNDESRRRLAALAQLRRVPPSELASSMARVAAAWGAPATGARSELPADGSPSSGGPAGAARATRQDFPGDSLPSSSTHKVHGARTGRCSILDASASPTITSAFGSQVTFRFSRMAMSHRWLITSDRTASASGLTVGPRDFTASTKFW